MLKLMTLILISIATTTFAALPPLYEGIAEIKAMLSDQRFSDAIAAGETIEGIQKSENGYTIFTQKHVLKVDVKYLPATRPGPQKFEFVFHDAVPYTQ